MATLRATEVFTPSEFPKHTYIERDEQRLEKRLREALETPGEVVSIAGPSKSGKTALVERVVGDDSLIKVPAVGLTHGGELWERVLDWIGTPSETLEKSSTAHGGTIGVKTSGSAGLPLVAHGSVEGQGQLTSNRLTESSSLRRRSGLQEVVREIANSTFVLLVDDFHYMSPTVQVEVAKEIKEAAYQGVKICTASVPHRADDVVRSNPELRGRIRTIDFTYWNQSDLRRIAEKGFPLLNVQLESDDIDLFAKEASGSPQLMQAICLQICFAISVHKTPANKSEVKLDDSLIQDILEETSTRTDYSSLVSRCYRGPNTRGTERKEFHFKNGTKGDVYHAILLALSSTPPRLTFSYDELSRRIRGICTDDTPQSSSIYQACEQISRISGEMYPQQRVLEWDDEDSIFDIVDPYFLFYLRWSEKITLLAQAK